MRQKVLDDSRNDPLQKALNTLRASMFKMHYMCVILVCITSVRVVRKVSVPWVGCM